MCALDSQQKRAEVSDSFAKHGERFGVSPTVAVPPPAPRRYLALVYGHVLQESGAYTNPLATRKHEQSRQHFGAERGLLEFGYFKIGESSGIELLPDSSLDVPCSALEV